VKGLSAKPVIDISISYETEPEMAGAKQVLLDAGYDFPTDAPSPFTAVKRDSNGLATHLIHMESTAKTNERAVFRDYLIAHPETAREYESLKQDLAKRFPDERKAYTAGKADFIKSVLERAGN